MLPRSSFNSVTDSEGIHRGKMGNSQQCPGPLTEPVEGDVDEPLSRGCGVPGVGLMLSTAASVAVVSGALRDPASSSVSLGLLLPEAQFNACTW